MSDIRIGGGYQPQSSAGAWPEVDVRRETGACPPSEKEAAPSLAERMLEAREKAEERREKYQLPKDARRYGDAPLEAYARLARARTVAQVNAAAGYARRQLCQLKAAKRRDPEHARQIQGAIDQLQKAAGRAGRKRRELTAEALAEKRRKKLLQEEQTRRARRLHQQTQNGKAMRYLRESGYIRQAQVNQRMCAQMDEENARRQERFQSVESAASPDPVNARYAQQAASLAAAPPPPTVINEA